MKAPEQINLETHQNAMAELAKQATLLRERIDQAKGVIALAQTTEAEVEALRQRRHQIIGENYLGKASDKDVQEIDAKLLSAETLAKTAATRAEAAASAIEQLEIEHAKLQAEISDAYARTPALLYDAHRAYAVAAIEDYRNALENLAGAHARLTGRTLACDLYADVSADPRRLYCLGANAPVTHYNAAAPNLPGCAEMPWDFDLRERIDAEMKAALEAVGGLDTSAATRRRTVAAAVDAADAAMAAEIERLG